MFFFLGNICRILRYSLILLQPAMLATQTHSFALITQPVTLTQPKLLSAKLLPELDYQYKYNLSRITVRQAINILADQGLLSMNLIYSIRILRFLHQSGCHAYR